MSAGAVYVERLKGPYRSASTHAFCMSKTLSKGRLAWRRKRGKEECELGKKMLNGVKTLSVVF